MQYVRSWVCWNVVKGTELIASFCKIELEIKEEQSDQNFVWKDW